MSITIPHTLEHLQHNLVKIYMQQIHTTKKIYSEKKTLYAYESAVDIAAISIFP